MVSLQMQQRRAQRFRTENKNIQESLVVFAILLIRIQMRCMGVAEREKKVEQTKQRKGEIQNREHLDSMSTQVKKYLVFLLTLTPC